MPAIDFLLGGIAAMGAGLFSNPFDVIKTRMQLQGELKARGTHAVYYKGVSHAMRAVAKADGILALQKGLIPALWFQLVLNGTRLGMYQTVDSWGWTTVTIDEVDHVSLSKSIACGAMCGAAGACVGSPFYLIKTHLQSQAAVDVAVGHQHEHTGSVDAMLTIYRKYGIKGLWRGVGGTIPRAAVGSAAQLSSYNESKELLQNYSIIFVEYPTLCAFGASLVSGVAMAIWITPFDVISTRLYNQGVNSKGQGLLYKNVFDCFYKTYSTEGFFGLYKGLIPSYVRAAPHTVLCLVFWDKLKALKRKYFEDEKNNT